MPNSIQHYKCSQEEEEEDILKVKVYAFVFDDSYLTWLYLTGRLKPSRATVDQACGIVTFETGLSGNPWLINRLFSALRQSFCKFYFHCIVYF